MTENKSWALSSKDKEKVEQKNISVVNDNLKLMLYNEFVEEQRKGFIAVMNFVNDKINNLIDEGRISEFVQIRARIKAIASALMNDSSKALDDIFGMEIITATEEEYDTIIRNLIPYMYKTKSKNHDKPNGYKAKHKYWTFKKDKMEHLDGEFNYERNIPMIEFQFKTSEVQVKSNIGPANHEDYKGEKREDIQKKYDEGGFGIFNTPYMWASDDRKMVLLSKEETLKKIYPFLNTKPKKGINR